MMNDCIFHRAGEFNNSPAPLHAIYAMERTADRCTLPLEMTSTLSLRATRALVAVLILFSLDVNLMTETISNAILNGICSAGFVGGRLLPRGSTKLAKILASAGHRLSHFSLSLALLQSRHRFMDFVGWEAGERGFLLS